MLCAKVHRPRRSVRCGARLLRLLLTVAVFRLSLPQPHRTPGSCSATEAQSGNTAGSRTEAASDAGWVGGDVAPGTRHRCFQLLQPFFKQYLSYVADRQDISSSRRRRTSDRTALTTAWTAGERRDSCLAAAQKLTFRSKLCGSTGTKPD